MNEPSKSTLRSEALMRRSSSCGAGSAARARGLAMSALANSAIAQYAVACTDPGAAIGSAVLRLTRLRRLRRQQDVRHEIGLARRTGRLVMADQIGLQTRIDRDGLAEIGAEACDCRLDRRIRHQRRLQGRIG